MDADTVVAERRETDESGEVSGFDGACPPLTHSLLDVLMPAKPPEPKNARVVRLFDYEARDEARPASPASPASPQIAKREPTPREAAKAARKLSLFAAAGLE